jgi:acyl-CoA synthetase (AMP-forming)/AMP-acid ligase II
VAENRESVYYLFEETAARRGNAEGIWSREGCYTFSQVYDKVNQYAHWYLARGVKPHDIVAFYLHNSPEFMFAWLGLLAVGAAPAMINYNLAGPALLHCLKVPQAKLILVEDDTQFASRIDSVREQLISTLELDIIVLDPSIRANIYSQKVERVDDLYRAGVSGDKPMCLFYTRYVQVPKHAEHATKLP